MSDNTLPAVMDKQFAQVLNIDVNKEDVVAIRVAAREQELQTRRTETQDLINASEKRQRELQTTMSDVLAATSEVVAAQEADTCKVMTAAGYGKFSAVAETQFVGAIKALAGRKAKPAHFRTNVSIGVYDTERNDRQYGTNVSQKLVTQKPDQAYLDAKQELQEQQDLVSELQSVLLKIRRSEQGLGTLERHARASLAANALNQTEEGQEILTAIQGLDIAQCAVPELPKALPCPKAPKAKKVTKKKVAKKKVAARRS